MEKYRPSTWMPGRLLRSDSDGTHSSLDFFAFFSRLDPPFDWEIVGCVYAILTFFMLAMMSVLNDKT